MSKKHTSAAALIASAKAKAAEPTVKLPPKLHKDLLEIVKHNHSAPKRERVLQEDILALAETSGVKFGATAWKRIHADLKKELGLT